MDQYKEEAFKAKQMAERRFAEKNFTGARSYALKARSLFPDLEGIAQMVATFEVFIASESKKNGGTDYYAVLGLKPSAGKREVKQQYKKLAVLLHPEKNKCIGADGAYQLISEAWTFLSNEFKKTSFYYKRKKHIDSMSVPKNDTEYVPGVAGFGYPPASERLDTFWTVCTSCKVQYEYLRKYVNKRLSCKNCRGTFVAVETGPAPVSASIHYSSSSHTPSNDYGGHAYDGATYMPTSSSYYAGHYPGHDYEYVANGSYEWSSYSGTSPVDPKCVPSASDGYGYEFSNGTISRGRKRVKDGPSNGAPAYMVESNPSNGCIDPSSMKASRLEKKRKVVLGSSSNGYGENASLRTDANNIEQDLKLSTRRLDIRKLLANKAKTYIQQKLEIMSSASKPEAMGNRRPLDENGVVPSNLEVSRTGVSAGNRIVRTTNRPVSINVPDPDFHDFDKNRSEECFKPRQIWAIYDEDDGMPRLYCVVREVLSVQPFKIDIAYLSSKTDAEFGSMKWVYYGFTKSCGHFRIQHSNIVEQVNIFSHLLNDKKTGRGGCVRIFPKTGEIWAVYKNWSPNWNRSTLEEVRHQYEMVEILGEYTEEYGVRIAPLVKLEGFKTVYRRSTREESKRWIPRREMLRFSHQVPSWFLKQDTSGLPGNCWDLDPAAIPEELLHTRAGVE